MADNKKSLSSGRHMFAIPGPSIMPDRVLEAFSRPMPDLYEGPLVADSDNVRERLPAVARTAGECFMMTGNGHAAWQMATSNTLSSGDKVLVLESGRFATVWGTYTSKSDVEIEILPGDDRCAVDPAALEERLRADVGRKIKAILVVHVDTATSVRNDIPALRAAIDAADHPALFMVDCIASMGCEQFEMDAWGVDVAVAGCQKGLMVPPGVSFVWAGERAMQAHSSVDSRVGYFDWQERLNRSNMYSYYAGTPPIAHIRGLRESLNIIDEEGGLDAVWERHRVLADAVKAAVAAWSFDGGVDFNISDPAARSNCVTTVLTGSIDPVEVRRRCADQAGLTLGLGIGGMNGFRVAHMGHLNPPMILGTLATIESILVALDAPMASSGVAAATGVVGSHLA